MDLSVHYLDTSALVKLYVREPGTDFMVRLADSAPERSLAIISLARVEFRAAVRQRERREDLPSSTAASLVGQMDSHVQSLYLVQPVTEAVLDEASALLDRHPLRTYDALQLAGCLTMRTRLRTAISFVCADRVLLRAAGDEGLATVDPAANENTE